MYGILDSIASGPIEALTSKNSTVVSNIIDFVVPKCHQMIVLRLRCSPFISGRKENFAHLSIACKITLSISL